MFCRVAPDDFWARLGTANDRAVIRLNVEPGRKQGEFNHGKLGIYRRKAGRFSPFGSNPTELVADRERSRTAPAWMGVGGVPSPREACAAKPEISGVRAPRPHNLPAGFDSNDPELARGSLFLCFQRNAARFNRAETVVFLDTPLELCRRRAGIRIEEDRLSPDRFMADGCRYGDVVEKQWEVIDYFERCARSEIERMIESEFAAKIRIRLDGSKLPAEILAEFRRASV